MEKARILIVEDEAITNQEIGVTLEDLGYEVTAKAITAEEALNIAETSDPDIILMDIQLPGIDGYEATRQIKADLRLKDIPIIALTASVLNTDINKCLESGMNDYIPKPFKREELLSTLSKYYKV